MKKLFTSSGIFWEQKGGKMFYFSVKKIGIELILSIFISIISSPVFPQSGALL